MQQAWTIACGLQCVQETHCRKRKKSKRERVETTAVVQGVMVVTWEHEDEDCVFEFGHEVSADVQRRETHTCISGASRSACRFGGVSESTTRGTNTSTVSDYWILNWNSMGTRKYTGKNADSTRWSSRVGWFLS